MIESDRQVNGFTDIQGRLGFIKVGLLILIALLGLRVWQLQIRDGEYYQELARDNRTRSIVLEPARGLLYDREGQLLANNVPSFNLYVSLEDVKDRPALIQQLSQFLTIDQELLQKKLSKPGLKTRVKIKGGLTLKEAALIESHRFDLPGAVIQPEYQRNYPLGGYASHLIGYVGEVSESQLQQEQFRDLHQGSVIGQYGVERSYDQYLRGHAGRELIEVDALGHTKRSISVNRPRLGDDFYLTIDIRLQALAEDLLGKEAGAIIVLNPQNGEVLAIASRPGFDPTALSGGLPASQWQELLQDSRHPLTNRAIQGQYPPGSTFKIVMAAAVLDTGTLLNSDHISCKGGFQIGRRTFRDWKREGHGLVNLTKALAESCDVYFYKAGNRMGIKTIGSYARQFGLGQKTGIDLPAERSGLMPSAEWKLRVKGEPWYPGETISVAIGQGFLMATPIQMAQVVASVATGGHLARPHVVRAIRQRATGMIQEWPPPPPRRIGLSDKTFSDIRKGLKAVVERGTARGMKSSLVSIAGKTGTAQVVGLRAGPKNDTPKELKDHAWFVGYAPVDDPQIAVVVLVEHMGHGGAAAAPLAKELIEAHIRFTSKTEIVPVVDRELSPEPDP
jgi:penicillin-binding protein 2